MAYRFRVNREHTQTQQSYRCEQTGCSHTGIPHLNECALKSEKTGKIEQVNARLRRNVMSEVSQEHRASLL
jgi:hypothetical protein